ITYSIPKVFLVSFSSSLPVKYHHSNPKNKSDYLMVNFAITDPDANSFRYDYKIKKLKDLLPAKLPLDIKINGKQNYQLTGGEGKYQILGDMKRHNVQVNLSVSTDEPAVLHNKSGYENYGDITTAGYFSYPRLDANGTLTIDGEVKQVEGELWYDRQWNCIGVFQQDVAWDWISIQLDKSGELMLYRLYHVGTKKTVYGGTFHALDGSEIDLDEEDIELKELAFWTSQNSKVSYPVKWGVTVDKIKADLIVEATIPQQELKLKFTPIHKFYYWEGMSNVSGTLDGQSVSGDSYVELTNRKLVNTAK
ncbi:MAG: lipocalin family protein, partial [Bacteroidota bacterium]